MEKLESKTLKQVKRIVVLVVGTTVVLLGIALMVLPGPAFVVIPLGLAILATEFVWAKRLLDNVKGKIKEMTGVDVQEKETALLDRLKKKFPFLRSSREK